MKILSLAEAKQAGTVQLYPCLEPMAIREKVAEANIWILTAYFIYGKFYGTVAQIGSPMLTLYSAGVPTGIFDDDYDSSQGIMGGYGGAGLGVAGACAKATAGAASEFGWIQVAGLNVVGLITDGTVDAGELLIHSGTDGAWAGIPDTTTAGVTLNVAAIQQGSSRVCGVANAADSSTDQLIYTATLKTYMQAGNLI